MGTQKVIRYQNRFLVEKVLELLGKDTVYGTIHSKSGLFQTSPKWQPQGQTYSLPSIFGFSQHRPSKDVARTGGN